MKICVKYLTHSPEYRAAMTEKGAVVKNLPASAGDAKDMGSIPRLGRSPGVGNGNPCHYSCLGKIIARGAWHSPWGGKQSDMTE